MSGALRRARQLASALGARISPADQALVASVLTPAELQLFTRMPTFDQRHCLDVYRTLVRGGYSDPALMRAALLHDIGKVDDDGRSIPLLYYGLFVVLLRVAPAIYHRAVRDGRGPLRPFVIHAAHDVRGAQLAAHAGSPSATVAILRDYADERGTALTRALHWADSQN